MSSPRVIDERVLAPIVGARPAGDDLSASADWVAIRKARPNLYDVEDKQDWEPADPVKSDWFLLKEVTESALCNKSKDLRLALFLAEACVRLHGFAGVRDGVWAVRGLLAEYWDSGLYPLMEDGDLEMRSGPLEWLNGKLADLLREIPLTTRSAPGKNYSLNYRNESLRQGGSITAEEFDAAALAGSLERYEALSEELREARSEFAEFERVVEEKFGSDGLALTLAKDAFEECRNALNSILRKKQPVLAAAAAAGVGTGLSTGGFGISFSASYQGSNGNGSWMEAEQIARSGDIDRALAVMASLAAGEPNGRIRFQRKLLLADICLQTSRDRLAKSILEELAELIDKHQLDQWENSDLIGAVWTRLYRCYRNEAAGIADSDRAADLFRRLCRLDPWQALACGDGR